MGPHLLNLAPMEHEDPVGITDGEKEMNKPFFLPLQFSAKQP